MGNLQPVATGSADTPVHPEAPGRLAALREHLAARGYQVELKPAGLTVVAPVGDGPRLSDEIVCKPRPSDGNRLWFWTSWGDPIAEADRIVDAAVVIGGNLRPRP